MTLLWFEGLLDCSLKPLDTICTNWLVLYIGRAAL